MLVNNQNVSSWVCRLEDILRFASTEREVNLTKTDNIVKSMFWKGVLQYLKDITGHLCKCINYFDEVPTANWGGKFAERSTQAKLAVAANTSDIKKLTSMVNKLASDVRALPKSNRTHLP